MFRRFLEGVWRVSFTLHRNPKLFGHEIFILTQIIWAQKIWNMKIFEPAILWISISLDIEYFGQKKL